MKKLLLALLFILPLRALCSSTDSLMVVMKTNKTYVNLKLATNTAIVIDWGEANKPDTVVSGIVRHQYSTAEYSKEHTIRLYGSSVDLIDFVCSGCDLTYLDLRNTINLRVFDCSFNSLRYLFIDLGRSKNTNLESFECQYNMLSTIDLSRYVNLKKLDCSGNKLIDLDVSKNKYLQVIDCSNNEYIKDLDVSKNTILYILCCHGNRFVTNKTALVNFAKSLPEVYNSNNPNEGTLIIRNSVSAGWIQDICNHKNWTIQ